MTCILLFSYAGCSFIIIANTNALRLRGGASKVRVFCIAWRTAEWLRWGGAER